MAESGDIESSARSEERQRRSDSRRSSRRRQDRRRRQQERAAEAAKVEARRTARAKAAVALGEGLEIDLDAEPSPVVPAGATRADRRVVARKTARHKRFAKAGNGLMVLTLLVGAAGLGVGLRLATRADTAAVDQVDGRPVLADGVDRQPALLLVTGPDGDGPVRAESAIILAYDRVEEVATVLLVPVSTVTDVPGYGVSPLSRSLEFGGAALAQATTDNMMGISLDGVAAMGYRNWATLFGRVGTLDIEVPERIVVDVEGGGTQVQFLAGVQSLDGPRAAEYLAARIPSQPELSALPRIQSLVVAWLGALAANPALLEDVVSDGLPMIDTGMAREELVALVRELVRASAEDRLEFRVLPVRPIGSGAEDGYRPDGARLDELVQDRFAGSVPGAGREGRSLQVLNGNGLPGIGQDIAARLLPAGFRVVLTGNADTFEHEKTKIVVYDDSDEQLAIAAEVRRLLGVGEVELSLTPQSVVDITIVVGADFPAS